MGFVAKLGYDARPMFYITTPIYYPNGEPHLGHVYTTIACDVLARWHRLVGEETYFLTGTDEHGIKMVKTAQEKNTTPLELATANSNVFRSLFKEFGITNDDFIRTSEDRHKLAVQQLVQQMLDSGDIYLGSYEGWYDEGQEEFITETTAKEQEYKSKISGKPLTRYKESTYFFKLTKYAKKVFDLIQSDEISVRPVSRKNEILSKLKDWNEDLSISRASLSWGIPMPNDPAHVLYVWIDALSNYITALGLDSQKYNKFWPRANHMIGKEILWFHAFYWPAMLLSLGRDLPRVLFAHGWWTSEGKKMSKTMGNFVDIEKLRQIVANYGHDALRFYLLRTAPFGNDLDFSNSELATSYAELGNVVGNLLNRTLNMVGKYRGSVPAKGSQGPEDAMLEQAIAVMPAKLKKAFDEFALQDAVMIPLEVARAANTYIDQTRPFSLAKDPAQAGRLDTVLNLIARATQVSLAGLIPVLPEKAVAGLTQLGIDPTGKTFDQLIEPLDAGHALGAAAVLFPRIETK
jgi:methionyl-tRNA synthetase